MLEKRLFANFIFFNLSFLFFVVPDCCSSVFFCLQNFFLSYHTYGRFRLYSFITFVIINIYAKSMSIKTLGRNLSVSVIQTQGIFVLHLLHEFMPANCTGAVGKHYHNERLTLSIQEIQRFCKRAIETDVLRILSVTGMVCLVEWFKFDIFCLTSLKPG